MKTGDTVKFAGAGNEEPGMVAGDVIIVLKQKPHKIYARKNMDLHLRVDISLTEALTGFQRVIRTLDERELLVKNGPCMLLSIFFEHISFSSD